MSGEQSIEEEIARTLAEWRSGEHAEPWEVEMYTEAAETLSPLLNRVRAEAAAETLREAAESSQAKMFAPAVYVGPRRLKLAISAKEWLNDCADVIEQNSEGNET